MAELPTNGQSTFRNPSVLEDGQFLLLKERLLLRQILTQIYYEASVQPEPFFVFFAESTVSQYTVGKIPYK